MFSGGIEREQWYEVGYLNLTSYFPFGLLQVYSIFKISTVILVPRD